MIRERTPFQPGAKMDRSNWQKIKSSKWFSVEEPRLLYYLLCPSDGCLDDILTGLLHECLDDVIAYSITYKFGRSSFPPVLASPNTYCLTASNPLIFSPFLIIAFTLGISAILKSVIQGPTSSSP